MNPLKQLLLRATSMIAAAVRSNPPAVTSIVSIRPYPKSSTSLALKTMRPGYPTLKEVGDVNKVRPYDHESFMKPVEAVGKHMYFLDAEESLREMPIDVYKAVDEKGLKRIKDSGKAVGYVSLRSSDSAEEAESASQLDTKPTHEVTIRTFPSCLFIPYSHGKTGHLCEPEASAYPGYGKGGDPQRLLPKEQITEKDQTQSEDGSQNQVRPSSP